MSSAPICSGEWGRWGGEGGGRDGRRPFLRWRSTCGGHACPHCNVTGPPNVGQQLEMMKSWYPHASLGASPSTRSGPCLCNHGKSKIFSCQIPASFESCSYSSHLSLAAVLPNDVVGYTGWVGNHHSCNMLTRKVTLTSSQTQKT